MQNQSNPNQHQPMSYDEFTRLQYDLYMAQFRQKSQSLDQNQSPDHQGARQDQSSSPGNPTRKDQNPSPPRQKPQSPDQQGQSPNPGHRSGAAAKTKKPDLFILYLLGGLFLFWFFSRF